MSPKANADPSERRQLGDVEPTVRSELARLARGVDEHLRAASESMGLLYMRADTHRLAGLTRALDQPMRRAAEAARGFAELMQTLHADDPRRAP